MLHVYLFKASWSVEKDQAETFYQGGNSRTLSYEVEICESSLDDLSPHNVTVKLECYWQIWWFVGKSNNHFCVTKIVDKSAKYNYAF